MKYIVALIFIIIVGISLRFYNFSILPIDGHAMRQTDTESVAYNFAFKNGNILLPQNSLIRPQTNTRALFFLEFPAYQYIISIGYRLFGWHIEIARIINFMLYALSTYCLYFVATYFAGKKVGIASAFLFTFIPASIFFFGHAIHPDVFAITTLLLSLFLYIKSQPRFNRGKKSNHFLFFLLAVLCLSLSVATRPFIAIVLPAYFYLLIINKAKWYEYAVLFIGSLGLYGLWKLWQVQFIEADSSWEDWVLAGQSTLFQLPILKQLIYKNIIGEVIGKSTSVLVLIGFVVLFLKRSKLTLFVVLWSAGIPIYWYIAPSGNIIHQYYADVYVIPLILAAAWGSVTLVEFIMKKNVMLAYTLMCAAFIIICYNGVRTSSNYFNDKESEAHMRIASEIKKVIPENSKLVYLAKLNSIPFSVYHRQGWMLGAYPVDVNADAGSVLMMKQYGAQYIVAGMGNTDLSIPEMAIISQHTDLVYASKWITVYKIR